ncbi:MAG: adenosylmethionine--8-amino-7-oxononanoate transaminase [Bacteroidetes bacterium]|nr:adenosylmethionine--8-amino-7-oxononanoate transaminase [Bacteroidota bacterium]
MAKTISERDKNSVWHPFTPQLSNEAITIVRGDGALLFDENGNSYVDAISSWWVNVHGHAHAHIAKKISEQANILEHSLFSGFTHKPGVELAEKLLSQFPQMKKVFYSDDGSTSVEVALKMALQYWRNKGKAKTKIIAFENGYHGDTFGSMSVGARTIFTNAFEELLFDVIAIPVPVKGNEKRSIDALKNYMDENTAAFIFEPMIQGAGGMVMYDASALDELVWRCMEKNIITIADEVMTGFGRTGKMFATDHCETKPDIICLSKGLTGGFLPLGATLCTEEIHSAFRTDDKSKTFFHGHSYTGNPLACTAALASLEIFEKENTLKRVGEIAAVFSEWVKEFSVHPEIISARSCGAVFALELKTEGKTEYLNPIAEKVNEFFPKQGIILRPLGNVIYVLPPYCITDEQLGNIIGAIRGFLTLN